MNCNRFYLNFFTVTIFIFFITTVNAQSQTTYPVKYINGSSNNRLEVLDWGGKGKALLFLSGLGNTAHVFADFAPRFRDIFHVYGLTRRGFGSSSQEASYDRKTLAADILAVIDSLHIDKVILIGHSIAGDEITKFASSYPDRVNKVVYLDAAYDYTDFLHIASNAPAGPKPTTQDSSSFIRFKNFKKSVDGFSLPDEELKNISIFSANGSYQKNITPDSITWSMFKGIEHPDFKGVNCPALAIYAVQGSVSRLFSFYASLDAVNKKKADTTFIQYATWEKEQRDLFKKQVKKGIKKEIIGAPHYIFISNPDETEMYIRKFLKN
jgi:non-heme chloroperoxidase